MPSRDGYGLSEGRSRCDKKTAKGNTSGNALSFHWRKAIDEVDKEERSSVLRIGNPTIVGFGQIGEVGPIMNRL
jgi:hypothetical protein